MPKNGIKKNHFKDNVSPFKWVNMTHKNMINPALPKNITGSINTNYINAILSSMK